MNGPLTNTKVERKIVVRNAILIFQVRNLGKTKASQICFEKSILNQQSNQMLNSTLRNATAKHSLKKSQMHNIFETHIQLYNIIFIINSFNINHYNSIIDLCKYILIINLFYFRAHFVQFNGESSC